MAYIIKYIEKSGEKLVYSRGLPQFFISDIMDDDIAAPIGLKDKNFCCSAILYVGTKAAIWAK